MRKYKLLDLYCKAGGAGMGYHRAGFEVTGVDIEFQKNYPFEFIQADAIEYVKQYGHLYDAIHASPPCQKYQKLNKSKHSLHPDLIIPTRIALKKTGKPYSLENVPDARHLLESPVMLCGTMFGLNIQRHRYFELYPEFCFMTYPCKHDSPELVLISGCSRRKGQKRIEYSKNEKVKAIQIDWMSVNELDQAIPPAYTEFIGSYFINYLNSKS